MNRLQRKSPNLADRAKFVPRLPHPSWREDQGALKRHCHVSADDFWQQLGI